MQKHYQLLLFFLLTISTTTELAPATKSRFSLLAEEVINAAKTKGTLSTIKEEAYCYFCEKALTATHDQKPACLMHLPTIEPIELHTAHYLCMMEALFNQETCPCGEQLINGDSSLAIALDYALQRNDTLLVEALRAAIGTSEAHSESPTSVTDSLRKPMRAKDVIAPSEADGTDLAYCCALMDYDLLEDY